ncbi:MAG: non-homologous end-joining DNA ligase [Saprospiraceae bacterium]
MPKKIIISEIGGQKIKLSNLTKVLYPTTGTMKAELIQYYIKIAPHILRYISQRPLTLIRFPDGVEGNRFYSKNKPNWTPKWVNYLKVDPEDEITYIMANDVATLAWMANLATLEIHPMQIKATNTKSADHFIFDLDPPETADFEVVKQLALNLKPFLESYGYHPFIKTSGSKGLHIYVPIIPKYDQETFIKSIKSLAKEYINIDKGTTLKINKKARKGRVLLDIYRNHKSQTCVAPYSTRGRIGAPVSAPITWEELKNITSSKAYNINTIFDKIEERGDPWENFYNHAVILHDQKISPKKTEKETSNKLDKYEEKRNFSKTKEPIPDIAKGINQNRYVVQLHDASNLHYDLRLEEDGVLRSWAIPKGLPIVKGIKRLGIETEPHPIKYLNFEGKIPKEEYGGGEMWVFDNGNYEYLKKDKKKLKFELKKGKLAGTYSMINTRGVQWLIDKLDDGDTMSEINLKPMLASMGKSIPSSEKYFFEIKWDGIRIVAIKNGKDVKLMSRNGNDLTEKFPKIVQEFSNQEPEHMIADGEIVALNENGSPNFGKTVGRMHLTGKSAIERASKTTKTVMYLFDCLYLDGRDIRNESNVKRREWLKVNLQIGEHNRFSDGFDDGEQLFSAIESQGMEGIMCKLKTAKYNSDSRSKSWLKIKVSQTDDAIIIGYTKGQGDRSTLFGSLHLAKLEKGELVYYGKVGTGFSQSKIKSLLKLLKAVPVAKKPIKNAIEEEYNTIWIAPKYGCQIKYASKTSNNTYREPVFIKMYESIE